MSVSCLAAWHCVSLRPRVCDASISPCQAGLLAAGHCLQCCAWPSFTSRLAARASRCTAASWLLCVCCTSRVELCRWFPTLVQVKEAHRRIMIANHPDAGGSSFIAAKVNEAKDMLLGKKTGSSSIF